ncbi:hypothetical protein [Lacisediminihabitans sp.]|uniref:hypothetical protein n=1 Tax=Lacisediminihabitans sp. TaxID=2787631 RepID=UPI002F9419C1
MARQSAEEFATVLLEQLVRVGAGLRQLLITVSVGPLYGWAATTVPSGALLVRAVPSSPSNTWPAGKGKPCDE